MDELLDIAEVASYLGVTERTVYNKVRSGDLPASKVGRLWRVRRRDLDAWLDRGRTHTAVEPTESPARADLERALATVVRDVHRRLIFVGVLSDAVEALGLPRPVIVGGNAVEFYTAGEYHTKDIDLAGASEPVDQVLAEWGFEREGRHWFDVALGLVVEVPGSTLPPEALRHAVQVEIESTTAFVIGIEDLIVDRLAACVFWNDEESCRWARVLVQRAEDVDLEYLSARLAQERVADAFVKLGTSL